jgi:hypothetical protein
LDEEMPLIRVLRATFVRCSAYIIRRTKHAMPRPGGRGAGWYAYSGLSFGIFVIP